VLSLLGFCFATIDWKLLIASKMAKTFALYNNSKRAEVMKEKSFLLRDYFALEK